MGIHGIYKEIGPGKRIALSKLALDKFEETGRPLRIAIDTSIWLFQIQASKGGTNPALRTFYYRLLRLIALSIHPIFVFDGPNKPPFKRNKRTGPNVASIPEFLAKQLLKQFGFPIHLAPGEAEAECALLQREGIVDAVLSEDVDTLMFGSGITIRNWSPEKSGSTPTHVNVYDAVETKNGPSGLDREGMILVALMSGGDYVPEGIPGCGPKTACEAAKAGFGSDLCKIPTSDRKAMSDWRERLQHELKTNESKLFKRKHGTLKIPDDFPRLDILGYYTHPAISNQSGLDKLKRSIKWDQDLDFPGLRSFTHDAFNWIQLEGAKHFIRSLAPSLVIRQLRLRAEQQQRLPTTNLQAIQEDEALLIKGIHGKRQHPVTDNSIELRVSFTPGELVHIDLDKEEPDSEFDAPPSSSQVGPNELEDELPLDLDDDGPKKRGPTKFDPQAPARIWVLESFVKVGVPLKVQDWEAERQTKLKPKRALTVQEASKTVPKAKGGGRKTKASSDTPQATINQFGKVTKPGTKPSRVSAKTQEVEVELAIPKAKPATQGQGDFIDLLSSPPVRESARTATPDDFHERASLPVLEDLPASVTKRRRRAPMQRSQTLPAETNVIFERPATPPLVSDTIETLDLVNSPMLPSPLPIPSKKARTQQFARGRRSTSMSSPGKSKQTTLDAWRASATPTKLQNTLSTIDASPVPAPAALTSKPNNVDTLDLTISPPSRHVLPPQKRGIAPARLRRVIPPLVVRPPLDTVSPNTSRGSTSSRSSTCSASISTAKRKDASSETALSRRTSPRLQKRTSPPLATDSLDLTSPLSHSRKDITPEADILDLTEISSPVHPLQLSTTATIHVSPPPISSFASEVRRSPRNHKATSPTSPPAAWKAREKKKRQIILRQSVVGAWDFVDVDSPQKTDGSKDVVLKGKERRKWRESEVEVLDFT
ncbi:flap structure-specific endonuclease-like protein [Plenodomus tracheiphilus IPT5]|uniref:Flap structure-specific endonuclease-like protein n=1 Tax=Plenodomus tracheiphilus IPT5 TaxID=1408161 RepID=A0A6A7B5C6_9PLEO|nr:flap structure-specific endonuclease-like protein [Plenodomus tracheiphilus IPT5]